MNKATKYGIFIGTPAIAIALLYCTMPHKAWKKYKAEHPVLFEDGVKNKPTYLDFCKSYWKTFLKTAQEKEEEITYTGGQLPEIDVIANKPNNE